MYKEYNDTIEMTFDNWFVNDDGKLDFYQKSQKIALDYIFEYEKSNRGSFLYSITISA